MDQKSIRPFSQGYMLRFVARNIHRQIDYSIRKTAERVGDFENDPANSRTVLSTLSSLHLLRKMMIDFERENNELFTEDLTRNTSNQTKMKA